MKAQRHRGTKTQRRKGGAGIRAVCLGVLCLAMALCFAAGAFASEGAGLCITVSGKAQIAGDRILLGQVAKISGGSPALRSKIADIDVGPAPRPGQERRISGNAIAVVLANADGIPDDIRVEIPDRVQVKGACQTLSEASLEKAFESYVQKFTGGDEVAVSRIKVRGIKPLPLGRISLAPAGKSDGEIKGKTSLRLNVAVDGEDSGQVTVSGWVDRYARVVCAARSISRNTVLSAEDVCLKRVNIAKAPDRLVYDTVEALGKRVRSTIQAGSCLVQHKLFEVPLVEKGDRVKLLVSAGKVNVSTLGIAKADGGAGDQIRVENISTQKTVTGRVVDASTVEVLF